MKGRVVLVAALLAAPVGAASQIVAGTVVDALSGRPVVGAMVRLLDAEGRPTGALYLTASDGRFALTGPGPGVYELTVERIGFARTRSGPVTLDVDGVVRHDVRVESQPVRLEGLEVQARGRRCDLGRGDSGGTQSLWDEARKALAAATWTEREAGLRFRVVASQRTEDPRSGAVQDERRQVRTLFGGNSVRTLPPEELASGGYVREAEGSRYFYGPDAETLLSDAFLETHCFEAVAGEGEDDRLVGLRFEPVDGRDVPDIEGRLWMDRATGRLDRIEFAYTDAFDGPGRNLAGGTVRFAELADGRWIVRSWSIRAPLIGVQRGFSRNDGTVERRMVTALSVQGSEVLSASGEGIDWRSDRKDGGVAGTVFDSTRSVPLAGADVRLAGRGWRATTDADGRFSLVDVPPGTYRIGFLHARLDTLGLAPRWTEVTVAEGAVVQAPLAVPGPERLMLLRCGDGVGRAVPGVLRDAAGTGIPGAAVTVSSVSERAPYSPGPTDAEGRFVVCDVVAGNDVTLVARLGGLSSAPAIVTWGAEGPDPLTLVLGSGAGAEAALVATVVSYPDGRPLEGAAVSLVDGDGAVRARGLSDDGGRVTLVAPEPGAYALRTERLGFEAVQGAPVRVDAGARRVEIRLSTEAIPLDEVVVEVRGTSRALERNGFYRREQTGSGVMLDREALDRLVPVKAGDVMRRQAGVTIASSSQGTTTRRFFVFRSVTRMFDTCLPTIYLDGQVVRNGGPYSSEGDERLSLDEIVPAQDIEAMELYDSPSSIPAQFGGAGAACGVVVVWTRTGLGG